MGPQVRAGLQCAVSTSIGLRLRDRLPVCGASYGDFQDGAAGRHSDMATKVATPAVGGVWQLETALSRKM